MTEERKTFSEITKEIKTALQFLDGLNEEIDKIKGGEGMSELAKRIIGMVKVQHSLPHASQTTTESFHWRALKKIRSN